MRKPRLLFDSQGFTLALRGLTALAAARRRLRVRYDQVAAAEVGPPERAGWWVWRIGTHWPGKVEMGTFRYGGRKRFLFHGAGTQRVLRLRLRGHAFDELSVDLDDPDAALREVELHMTVKAAP